MSNNFYGDYHIHSNYSHGKGTVLEIARAAKNFGFKEIAITDHGFSHIAFGLRRRKMRKLRQEIAEAKAQTGIEILCGIESNLISTDGDIDARPEDEFDIIVCNYHKFIYPKRFTDFLHMALPLNLYDMCKIKQPAKQVAINTNALVKAVEKNKIDIISHINFVFPVDCMEVAKACAVYGTMIEISGKKQAFNDEQFLQMQATGVKFIFNSDAHSIKNIGNFKSCISYFEHMNLDLSVAENYGKKPIFRAK